jgi:hypothetical protein
LTYRFTFPIRKPIVMWLLMACWRGNSQLLVTYAELTAPLNDNETK